MPIYQVFCLGIAMAVASGVFIILFLTLLYGKGCQHKKVELGWHPEAIADLGIADFRPFCELPKIEASTRS